MDKEEAYKWFNLGVAHTYMCEYTQSKEELLSGNIHREQFEEEWNKEIDKWDQDELDDYHARKGELKE